jgi:hypothetical protein
MTYICLSISKYLSGWLTKLNPFWSLSSWWGLLVQWFSATKETSSFSFPSFLSHLLLLSLASSMLLICFSAMFLLSVILLHIYLLPSCLFAVSPLLSLPSFNSYPFLIAPWPESASKPYPPSDRRLWAKLVPTFCELKKFYGLSPRANYTDRATAACRRSDCQLLRIEGATWSALRIPTAVFTVL